MSDIGEAALAPPPARVGRFFGEPRGLAILLTCVGLEAASYQLAMMSLLSLAIDLAQGGIESIAGYQIARSLFPVLGLRDSPISLHWLCNFVASFTPLLGGLATDLLIGRRRAIFVGCLLIGAGETAMLWNATLLPGLLVLAIGAGFFRASIYCQIAELYPIADVIGRTRAFLFLYLILTFGTIFGSFGMLLDYDYGHGIAVGLAIAFLIVGLIAYGVFRQEPQDVRASATPLAGLSWSKSVAPFLLVVLGAAILHTTVFREASTGALMALYSPQSADHPLSTGFFAISGASTFVAVVFLLWHGRARNWLQRTEMGNIAVAAWLVSGACLAQAVSFLAVPVGSQISLALYLILGGIAVSYHWPAMYVLVSRTSPYQFKATGMGTILLLFPFAKIALGDWDEYDALFAKPVLFWVLHAAVAVMGALLVMLAARPLARLWKFEQAGTS